MRRIAVTEGVPFAVDEPIAQLVRRAALRLKTELRPRLPLLREDGRKLVVTNLVGAVRLDAGLLLEVSPKVDADEDWTRATLELLLPSDRIDVAGERPAGLAPPRRELLDVIAATYAARLGRALRRDGPMAIIQRHAASLPLLRGRLQLAPYLRNAPLRPHRFPVSFDALTMDNDFTRAMALVARMLARSTAVAAVASNLLGAARALRPGSPEEAPVDLAVLHRPFPEQWAIYRPSWSIAVALLSRASLLGPRGQHRGLEVAIEAWPLLEHLLNRSVGAAIDAARADGRRLEAPPHCSVPLLTNPAPGTSARSVVPDACLGEEGQVIATFDAKYSPGPLPSDWPRRDHVFQAVASAAASGSPLAVLVYPARFDSLWWDVNGFGGRPSTLVAIGLGLYSYRRGSGDTERGDAILQLLDGRPMDGVSASRIAASE